MMNIGLKMVLAGLLLCVCPIFSFASEAGSGDSGWTTIDHISIEGARKTRRATILRELEFHAGDSLKTEDIPASLERNRLRLMNIGIFSNAELNIEPADAHNHVGIKIRVTEGWYILPVPLLSLADRNFNVWWEEFHHSFKRVNYGLDWTQLNLTGRADILKANAQFGYTNSYSLNYRSPSLNKSRTMGFETTVSYSRAHEVAFNTIGNKLQFLKIPETWLVRQIYLSGTFNSRPRYFTTQSVTLEYRDNRIADTVGRVLNPEYFLHQDLRQRHTSVIYGITFDHRDIKPYPLSGWRAIGEFRWNGLLPGDDLHVGRLFGQFEKYFPLTQWLSLETIALGRVSYPRRQLPWNNNQGLGYGSNFVRGFEYYVVDGLDFGVFRTSWHFKILSKTWKLGKFMPLKAYKTMPLQLYLALNTDAGYANDPYYSKDNPLANRALLGYGPGLDIVAWYDKTIRVEWSWNDLGEHGLFLRINTGF